MNVKFYWLGCKVNHYECSALKSLFLSLGYTEAKSDEQSDVCVVNTCSVTATADQKSRQLIRRVRKENPHSILVVMGCFSQNHSQQVADWLGADIIIGTSNRSKIIDYINCFKQNHKQIISVNPSTRFFCYEELGTTSCSENVRAYLKIQDGCDNFCSYCLIPFVRGKSRSRSLNAIVDEAQFLINCGYKELVITGIDVGSYRDGEYSFSDLIEKLLDIPNLFRLRISSIEASQIDDKFLFLLQTRKNLAHHLHLSLQSGSDSVLKRMNRHYTCKEFYRVIENIRNVAPDCAITTDIIVGYPQESDEEFEETYHFIQRCQFSRLHVFPFSAREGTKAAREIGQVDAKLKKERVNRLISLSDELWKQYTSLFDGKPVEVLVESYDKKSSTYFGHTSNYLEVNLKSSSNIIGQVINSTFKKV